MEQEIYNSLTQLYAQREEVSSNVKENLSFLAPFVDKPSGALSRSSMLSGQTVNVSATATGFVAYYLHCLTDAKISDELPKALTKELAGMFELQVGSLSQSFVSKHNGNAATDIGSLPNCYNSSLQVVGILALYKSLNMEIQDKLLREKIDDVVNGLLIEVIERNNGFIDRIGKDSAPSPYLTFWAIESLILYCDVTKSPHPSTIYKKAYNWINDTLAKSIAYNYAGLIQSFDPIEVSYLLLTLFSIIDVSRRVIGPEMTDSFDRKVAEHAIDLIFSQYFSGGCLTKSLPVFATKTNFSLSCPTVEPISLLLIKQPDYFFDHSIKLAETFDWLKRNRLKNVVANSWMWRSEWEHQSSPPGVFMTVSAMTFIIAYKYYLDILLSSKAARSLGVIPYYSDLDTKAMQYPSGLKDIVENYIVVPIKGERKDLAHYSMILFGPPGTAKTTITKKIAQDLHWPLLVINANEFLKNGLEKIDFEAEKLFKVVSFLKNVVVLFDEVEELVLTRESAGVEAKADQRSRFLTTSMLPRINDLRSTERVVFIFATNYLAHIDAAIKRTGRFDIVHCVMPPDDSERERIIKVLMDKMQILKSGVLGKQLVKKSVILQTKRFCYADLRDLVKRVIILCQGVGDGSAVQRIIEENIAVGQQSIISETEFEAFNTSKSKFDRPKPKM